MKMHYRSRDISELEQLLHRASTQMQWHRAQNGVQNQKVPHAFVLAVPSDSERCSVCGAAAHVYPCVRTLRCWSISCQWQICC